MSIPIRDSLKTFRFAYYVHVTRSWTVHEDLDLLAVKMLSGLCVELTRPFAIQHLETQSVVRVGDHRDAPDALNLFYNMLSDRINKDGD